MTSSAHDAISPVLRAVVELAGRVGELLRTMQSTDRLGLTSKSDGSPVTHADRDAHDMLEAALPAIAPYLVVSEESAPGANLERQQHERVWIVDPLDGTRAYITGSQEYTVNVAIVERGVPILGVIAAPGLGVTYFAERGAGAFALRAGGSVERIACRPEPDGQARIVVSGSDIKVPWTHMPIFAGAYVEGISSCVKLGYIAEGSAVAYPRLTGSSEWDIAAGHAIVNEAGGRVIGTDGRELMYNKADPLNTAFLATGSPRIAAAYATILEPIAPSAGRS